MFCIVPAPSQLTGVQGPPVMHLHVFLPAGLLVGRLLSSFSNEDAFEKSY